LIITFFEIDQLAVCGHILASGRVELSDGARNFIALRLVLSLGSFLERSTSDLISFLLQLIKLFLVLLVLGGQISEAGLLHWVELTGGFLEAYLSEGVSVSMVLLGLGPVLGEEGRGV
jgi:hypothetical protein